MLPLNPEAPEEERGVAVIIWEITELVQARRQAEELAEQTEAQRAWLQTEYGAGEVLQIVSLECELNVDALYSGINFESETGF